MSSDRQTLLRAILAELLLELPRSIDYSDIGFTADEEFRHNRLKAPFNKMIQPVVIVDPNLSPMRFIQNVRHNSTGYARVRLNYAADGVAPHAEVARASRQITSTERAVLLHVNASLIKATAATTVGKAFVTCQESTGTSIVYITILTNVVGDSKHDSVGGSIVEYDSNSNFIIATADANGGATPGTIDYRAAMNLVVMTV